MNTSAMSRSDYKALRERYRQQTGFYRPKAIAIPWGRLLRNTLIPPGIVAGLLLATSDSPWFPWANLAGVLAFGITLHIGKEHK